MANLQFPMGFVWGAASSAYQIEGAHNEGGRGPSIWDTFSHTPGKVRDGDNGDVACDSYHRYEEDIRLMKELGIGSYRFSVAWPRILPDGTGKLNQEGLDYYHRMVDELLLNGIEPFCTLYHWDLPQALQDKGGWENREAVDAFVGYAKIMFEQFGGKIKHWITINEPWCAAFLSNYEGHHAPGKQDLQAAVSVGHHLLVAHGKTVKLFRKLVPDGQIGYAPNMGWTEPYSDDPKDIEACRRDRAYVGDWFMQPVLQGGYPEFLVNHYRERNAVVPAQKGDMEIIAEPIDFLGVNYYTGGVGRYMEGAGDFDCEHVDMGFDKTDIGWNIYPEGFYQVLRWIKREYGDIPIYITENGACYNDGPVEGKVCDPLRIHYLKSHLTQVHRAISGGVNLKGYFLWSVMDNFEWAFGYSMRFGLIHVDYNTQQRTPKESYHWYKKTVRNNRIEV